MLEGGADIRYVSEMLGRAKLETTAFYTNSRSPSSGPCTPPPTHPAGNDVAGAEVRLLQPVAGTQQSS